LREETLLWQNKRTKQQQALQFGQKGVNLTLS